MAVGSSRLAEVIIPLQKKCLAPSHVTWHCSYSEVEWFLNSIIGSVSITSIFIFPFIDTAKTSVKAL